VPNSKEIIANTVLTMNRDLLKSVLTNMQTYIKESEVDTHDPSNMSDFVIVTAAFVMAIQELDELFDPRMSTTIIKMLETQKKKSMN
jgi:hypothetical protein